MRYFVTGATGFIGGHLARRLVADGHEVVALVRSPERAGDLAALGVSLHQGDITDKDSLRAPMTGVDGIYHVAAWYKIGARDSSPGWRINVEGTRNVLETMRELAIPRGVYTSTLAVFGDTHGRLENEEYQPAGPWLSEYDRTKWAGHYEVALPMMRDGLPLTVVLPGLVYGPGDTSSLRDSIVQYLRGRLPMTPAGTALCWGYIDDMVDGHVRAMERGQSGESYIIAGPAQTLRYAFDLAQRITGIRAPRLHPSPVMMRASATIAGLAGRVLPLPELYTAESLRVLAGVTYLGDSSKARRELEYHARPLEDGLRLTLAHEMQLLGMTPPVDASEA